MLAPRDRLETPAGFCRTTITEVYNTVMVDFESELENLRQTREANFQTKLAEQKVKKEADNIANRDKRIAIEAGRKMSAVLKKESEKLGEDFHEDFGSSELIEEFLTRLFGPKRIFNSAVPRLSHLKGIVKETTAPHKIKFRAMDTYRLVRKDVVFDLGLRGSAYDNLNDAVRDYRFRELVIGGSVLPVLNPTGTNQEYLAEVVPFLIGMDIPKLHQTAREQLIEYGKRIS